MIAVAWILLSSVAWCLASPLNTVPGAIEASPSTHNDPGSDVPEIPQEKRLLKYFLPSGSSWMSTQQEGSKRGISRNYLRFGRGEEDKRGGRNFLRFGRGDSSSIEDVEVLPETEDSIEKRNRNFLRFGRDRNFLRFGRSDAEEFSLPGGPLAFTNVHEQDLEEYPTEEEKRAAHKNYLRFGRGNRNFLRFGRDGNRNFLRFGRSVDRQLNEQKARDAPLAPTTVPHSSAKTQESHRSKRSATPYNYVVLPSHGPAAWSQDFQPDQDEDLEEAIEGPESAMTKRGYNRSFLRFGRDRNFLRFGKRNDESDPQMVMMEPASYPRYVRAPQGNFLRFG